MKKDVLIELLDEQAVELQGGMDRTAEMQGTFEHEPAVIHELLGLGQRLWRSLPQMEPARAFVNDLKARLLEGFARPVSSSTPVRTRERRLLLALAGIGMLVYVANITVFSVKLLIYVLSLGGLVLGLRKWSMLSSGKQRLAI